MTVGWWTNLDNPSKRSTITPMSIVSEGMKRHFLLALVDSAFDRIESSVPPCVTPEEATDANAVSYRHGILELVAATFQTMRGTEQCWSFTDLMHVSGFEREMQNFVNARLGNPQALKPEGSPIVTALMNATQEE